MQENKLDLEMTQKTLEDKTCTWKYLSYRPTEKCPTCDHYDDKCKSYVPMKETEAEAFYRIAQQLDLKFIP